MFRGNTKQNLYSSQKSDYPNVFYSYFIVKEYLKTRWVNINNVDLLTRLLSKVKKYFIGKFSLIFRNLNLSDILLIKKLNKAKVVYATNDYITLKLAILKKKKVLKAKLVGNLFSILDDTHHYKNIDLLKYVDVIVVFSKILEKNLLDQGFKNINFLKFGVDVSFYNLKRFNSKPIETNKRRVLGLGVDKSRDWGTFKKIAQKMPDTIFKVITKDSFRKDFAGYENIKFLGNCPLLTSRNEMFSTDLLFLPSHFNYYFAGQTTLFNALAMKIPVIMPYDLNVDAYNLDKTLFYSQDYDIQEIINLIDLVLREDPKVKASIEYNYNLIIKEYNHLKLATKLRDLFMRDIN